jgi:phosphoglycerate dehydrogenase-like enzyme
LRFHTSTSIQHAWADLTDAEVLLCGWGMVPCDDEFLQKAPRLKAIFHAAGSVRGIVTDAMWNRGIRISTANSALARSVAEFTLAEIILSLKSMWLHVSSVKQARTYVHHPYAGTYRSTLGLISIGTIARRLLDLLTAFELRIMAYDPFLSPDEAKRLGIELCSLDEIFASSDVVSLHTPWLPETERLIRGHHFEKMRPGATFINTARGAVVDEAELAEVFARRTDLYALLDVTYPEPPPSSSPLYALPNVIITPHISGGVGPDCRRMGRMAVEECARFLRGEPLLGEVTREMMPRLA